MTRKKTFKKTIILQAAEKVFSSRGFGQTKVSDIASSVGISDATLYEHFANKEDLLFRIPEEKTQELITMNEDHLRGLVGAEVKLRKLIWNYMEFLENDRDYASIILFELRSNRRFYQSRAYELIRQFNRKFIDIILEGKNEGTFRSDLNPYLFRNLIFGALDHVMITWLLYQKPIDLLGQTESFFDLVMKAARSFTDPGASDSKRAQILKAAATIFAKKGYDKAKISEIARLAGVGDGTIYEYFRNKEDILFSLPEERTRELIQIHREHIEGISHPGRRFSILVKDYLDYLQVNRDYASLVIFELRYNRNFYRIKGYDLFREFGKLFIDAIRNGQEDGLFRKEADPILSTKMVFGLIDHTMLTWLLFQRPPTLIAQSDAILELLLSALRIPSL